jgi:phospholipase C
VRSFIESRKEKVEKDLWMVPMGYYTSKDVPVYDHLARQYAVCDRWYASIPGDTWPNRLYAVAGKEGRNVLKTDKFLNKITDLPPLRRLRGLPIFDVPAFTRQLKRGQWRWYSHDPGSLRAIDSAYRDPDNLMRDNFAFFDRRKVSLFTEILDMPIVGAGSFLDDVASGDLPQVAWIDPNFVDLNVLETSSNDDHPPSDIRAGQAFVFDVYDALLHSKDWKDTMLVITYDEHGGFYDHVTPPLLPKEDESRFKTYGVRVPAIVVGPRVRRGVLHEPQRLSDVEEEREQPQWDHTAISKTILLAFADNPEAAIRKMPSRVQRAPNLGEVLLARRRKDIDDPRNARNLMDQWREEARRRRLARPPDELLPGDRRRRGSPRSVAPDGAGQPVILTDFQAEWQKAADVFRRLGADA